MSVSAMRVYEYVLICDHCGVMEVYHTGDSERGIKVHSITTAIRAASFHRRKRKILCPICTEEAKKS